MFRLVIRVGYVQFAGPPVATLPQCHCSGSVVGEVSVSGNDKHTELNYTSFVV